MSSGYVYILTNASLPGLVKIGRTSRSVEKRAAELSSTGLPTPFEVVFKKATSDSIRLESEVHFILEKRGFREARNREFFRVSVSTAKELINGLDAFNCESEIGGEGCDSGSSISDLYNAMDAVKMPDWDEPISQEEARRLEGELASIGDAGLHRAYRSLASTYESNFKSHLKCKEYWFKYLEASKKNAMDYFNRRECYEVGRSVVIYLDTLHHNGWLQECDFKYIQNFLITGNSVSYEGYFSLMERTSNLPDELKKKAMDL